MTEQKKLLLALAGLVLAVCLMGGLYLIAKPEASSGTKLITVIITDKSGLSEKHSLLTSAQFLSDVLLQNELVECTNVGGSIYVVAANGIQADESKQEWWGLTIDGEMAMTGIADTPVTDGSTYELTLNVGW